MKTNSGMTFTALAMVGAFMALPMLVGEAQASTTSKLMNCRFDTRQKVMDCCQRVLRTETRPYWISSGSGACSGAVQCYGGGNRQSYASNTRRRCYIALPPEESSESFQAKPSRQREYND